MAFGDAVVDVVVADTGRVRRIHMGFWRVGLQLVIVEADGRQAVAVAADIDDARRSSAGVVRTCRSAEFGVEKVREPEWAEVVGKEG